MNSTHAAWVNVALALVSAIAPLAVGVPGTPFWIGAAIAAVNAGLHALLPDAPAK